MVQRPAGGSPSAEAAWPYALFTAGSSPPAKTAASPYAAFMGGDAADDGAAAEQQQPGGGNGDVASEAVMGLAAAARQYRANRSASASDGDASAANPFNNVPADWSDANCSTGRGAKPQALPVSRMNVAREGRCECRQMWQRHL